MYNVNNIQSKPPRYGSAYPTVSRQSEVVTMSVPEDTTKRRRRGEAQRQIAHCLLKYKMAHRNSPTWEELAHDMGYSQRTCAHNIVQNAVRKNRANAPYLIDLGDKKVWMDIDEHGKPMVHYEGEDVQPLLRNEKRGLSPQRRKHSADVIRGLYRQQRGRCWWCGEELFGVYQIDHRVPLAKGGSDHEDNLCLACPRCNKIKSDKMPFEIGRLI